ncbi:40S ribosomal protein S3-2 isoform X2 [Phoenix dactylifera]|uniref:Small ribosomal subunit protein uS3 n=1 Tax=Phoenix dactylifera TaxID=42345 RepID=A0A8B9A8R7_PHODC|nr:40S ribosomal protein S3-2 isoform X2 [Phoenix dactylifera]
MATQISKKRKFVADGVFFAELNEVLTRELAEDGYSGVEVRVTPMRTEIIIRATRTQNVLGEKGRRIRELTSVVQKRFNFPENSVELYAEKVNNRGLWAIAQAESLRYKLLGGLAVRRACYGVLRFIMESGAKGCEVIVSGKLRAQRAKSMKFKDGYMISSGQPVNEYIDSAVRHVLLRQDINWTWMDPLHQRKCRIVCIGVMLFYYAFLAESVFCYIKFGENGQLDPNLFIGYVNNHFSDILSRRPYYELTSAEGS